MCHHHSCATFRQAGATGIACVILNLYIKNGIPTQYVSLLGLEKHGNFKGTFNLCAGGLEPQDRGCYLMAARRELAEEFKIQTPDFTAFDNIFKGSQGRLRYIMHHNTPVLIGVVKKVSRGILNPLIQRDNANHSLPFSYKEMECVDWFRLDGRQMDGLNLPVSSFASSVMRKVNLQLL